MLALKYLTGQEPKDTGEQFASLAEARKHAAWLLQNDPKRLSHKIGIFGKWGWFDGSKDGECVMHMTRGHEYPNYTQTEWPGIWEYRWPAASKPCYNPVGEPFMPIAIQKKMPLIIFLLAISAFGVFMWATSPDTRKMSSGEYEKYQRSLDERQYGIPR